jgi:hypothetical protein
MKSVLRDQRNVSALAFAASGATFLSASADGNVIVRDTATLQSQDVFWRRYDAPSIAAMRAE